MTMDGLQVRVGWCQKSLWQGRWKQVSRGFGPNTTPRHAVNSHRRRRRPHVIHPLDARTVLRPFLTSPALGLRPFIVPVVVKGEVSFLPPKIVSRFLRLLAGEF